jgi:polyketide cyclase/dehydrase/lipid transport protein
MMHSDAVTMIKAPKRIVSDVYADFTRWPSVFPTISGVRLIRDEPSKQILEIDHLEGKVINEMVVRSPDEIELWEVKRRYNARFLNRFEAVPGGTRFVVSGEIDLQGIAKLLQPFLRGYVRRQMERWQLQPVKAEGETRARRAADCQRAIAAPAPGGLT